MKYRLHIAPVAARSFDKLPEQARYALFDDIMGLADNPTPANSKPLQGNLRGWRSLRTGNYRTAYTIDEQAQVIYVRGIGHRERFYDLLKRMAESRPDD